jgi:hypothetical protein
LKIIHRRCGDNNDYRQKARTVPTVKDLLSCGIALQNFEATSATAPSPFLWLI